MNFGSYDTEWDRIGRANRGRFASHVEFYRKGLGYVDSESCADPQTGFLMNTMIAESAWLSAGKPYYKIWPGYAAMLSRTSLRIPAEVFEVPFPAFAIYLPHIGLLRHRTMEADAILVAAGLTVKLAGQMQSTPEKGVFVIATDQSGQCGAARIALHPGMTIEECFEATDKLNDAPTAMLRIALRLTIAVSLLAVSVHRCVEHDVIAALRERYDRAATNAEREHLAEKSRRRGVNGWRIGRGRCLSLTTAVGAAESEPTGRQLTYQHIRGGHFHTVRCGPGRSQAKVMFFEPTVVRPDLPPPPYEAPRKEAI